MRYRDDYQVPAPWSVTHKPEEMDVEDPDILLIRAGDGAVIAQVSGHDREEQAQLMSFAPEMIELLIDISSGDDEDCDCVTCELVGRVVGE
jgi:streptomycin 6-kinase